MGARQTEYGKEPVEFLFNRFFFVVNQYINRANKRFLLELTRYLSYNNIIDSYMLRQCRIIKRWKDVGRI